MEFRITASSGESVNVEAENWLIALGKGVGLLDIASNELDDLSASRRATGMICRSVVSGRSWTVRPIEQKIKVVAAGAATLSRAERAAAPVRPPTPEPASRPRPPTLDMPLTSSLHRVAEDVETLAERLFDLSMDLSVASPDQACQMTLELLQEFIHVEAASVVRGTINDDCLTFVAASGPGAASIIGREIGFSDGLAGACFETRAVVIAQDVSADSRHLRHFDESSGFTTRSVLCVPIEDTERRTHGVLQLLNPREGSFSDQDVEVAQTIARTLAGVLSDGLF